MNPTKIRMLEAGRTLLLNKGVEATAVEDVLKATKTGKSQFYHFFGSKAGMVKEVLEGLTSEYAATHSAATSWEEAQAYLNSLAHTVSANGHPAALMAMTIRPEDRATYPELLIYYQTLRAPFLQFLNQEQEAGRFMAGISTTEMADLALTNIIGASILAAIHAPAATMAERAAHHMYLYVKAYARA